MNMNILFEVNYPSGECWFTTSIQERAVSAAKSRAKEDGVPMEVAKYNLRTGKVYRNTYYPDGSVQKDWKLRK